MNKFLFLVVLLVSFSLFAGKPLKMVTTNWPPYYDTAKGGKHGGKGVFTELTKAAFKSGGYDLTVEYVPWSRAMDMSSSGDYPGLLGPYFSKDRAKTYVYSEKVMDTENVFFAKKGSGITWKTLKDLSKYTIGTGKGWTYGEEFDKATFLKKDPVPVQGRNIKKLAAGRIDLFIGAKAVVLYEIDQKFKEHVGKFEVVKPTYIKNGLYNAFSKKRKDHKAIIDAFNKGLKAIKADGTYAKILKEYSYLQIGQ